MTIVATCLGCGEPSFTLDDADAHEERCRFICHGDEEWHGTVSGAKHYGCHGHRCRAAVSVYETGKRRLAEAKRG